MFAAGPSGRLAKVRGPLKVSPIPMTPDEVIRTNRLFQHDLTRQILIISLVDSQDKCEAGFATECTHVERKSYEIRDLIKINDTHHSVYTLNGIQGIIKRECTVGEDTVSEWFLLRMEALWLGHTFKKPENVALNANQEQYRT